jgi:hypothetical protein
MYFDAPAASEDYLYPVAAVLCRYLESLTLKDGCYESLSKLIFRWARGLKEGMEF